MVNAFKKTAPMVAALILASCGGGDGGNSSDTGFITIGMTDAPVDQADAVVVTFDAITLKPSSGSAIEVVLDEPLAIDLLSYQGDNRVLILDDFAVSAGSYNWMRLSVIEADSYIEIDGQQHALEIPSGAQSGLKMNRGFTVGAGALTDFTLDFDLRKSVHQEGAGDYKLRPVIRLVDNLTAGAISGTVPANLLTAETCANGDNDDVGNAVYLFTGLDQPLQDVQGNEGDPLVSASVTYNPEADAYEYTLGFVPAGDYTLAFTCDASLDIATEDNSASVLFSSPINTSVTAEQTSVVNFEM